MEMQSQKIASAAYPMPRNNSALDRYAKLAKAKNNVRKMFPVNEGTVLDFRNAAITAAIVLRAKKTCSTKGILATKPETMRTTTNYYSPSVLTNRFVV